MILFVEARAWLASHGEGFQSAVSAVEESPVRIFR
jgi:hypothetical protein